MRRYKTEDGTVVDTEKAQASWEEASDWNGKNRISRATGSQWEHQTLYRSVRGRYYVVHMSQWEGTPTTAAFVSNEEAAKWLLINNRALPEDLKALESEASE